MRFLKWFGCVVTPALMAVTMVLAGCDNSATESNTGATGTTPGAAEPAAAEGSKPTTQPLIPIAQMADWCPEHQVPESVCTRCNESLVAGFKAKGDWDEKHNLPKSQCFECDPSLKQKFAAAYKEKYGKDAPVGGEGEKH